MDRRTGGGGEGQMYVEYAGCANQRPTGIESGNPFSSATTGPKLYAKLQFYSFQVVLRKLSMPFKLL